MKLQLHQVSLVAVDCLNTDLTIKVIEHCKKLCDFGDVKFLTSIPTSYEHHVRIKPITSLVNYSIFMLKEIYKYIDTPNLLICQRDGWILNPQSWKDEWLELDFLGGLYQQADLVGSGGFSLRSRKIMEDVSKTLPEWNGTKKEAEEIQKSLSFYEDGELSLTSFSKKYKIASLEQAADFSQAGNRNPLYFREHPFGFHRTHQVIDFNTGRVNSSDLSRDITASYDEEINNL